MNVDAERQLLNSIRQRMPTTAVRHPTLPPLCPKCGRDRTRIVGQSGEPLLVHYRCDAFSGEFKRCGHIFSRPLGDEHPPDAAA